MGRVGAAHQLILRSGSYPRPFPFRKAWCIPADAEKPTNPSNKSGKGGNEREGG